MYVIYTQDSCGFCVMAKELLENRGQEYTEIEIDQDNDAKNYIKKQIYDYQWINKKHVPVASTPLDIVFISNGESNAEKNWEYLHQVHQGSNRIVRVDGVKGRAEAYRASLEASNTDWAFCVFASSSPMSRPQPLHNEVSRPSRRPGETHKAGASNPMPGHLAS